MTGGVRYITYDRGQEDKKRSRRGRDGGNARRRPESYGASGYGAVAGPADEGGRRSFSKWWWLLILLALLAVLAGSYLLFWPDDLGGSPDRSMPNLVRDTPDAAPGGAPGGDEAPGAPLPPDGADAPPAVVTVPEDQPATDIVLDLDAGTITVPIESFPGLALDWCRENYALH